MVQVTLFQPDVGDLVNRNPTQALFAIHALLGVCSNFHHFKCHALSRLQSIHQKQRSTLSSLLQHCS